eukprot:RCo052657
MGWLLLFLRGSLDGTGETGPERWGRQRQRGCGLTRGGIGGAGAIVSSAIVLLFLCSCRDWERTRGSTWGRARGESGDEGRNGPRRKSPVADANKHIMMVPPQSLQVLGTDGRRAGRRRHSGCKGGQRTGTKFRGRRLSINPHCQLLFLQQRSITTVMSSGCDTFFCRDNTFHIRSRHSHAILCLFSFFYKRKTRTLLWRIQADARPFGRHTVCGRAFGRRPHSLPPNSCSQPRRQTSASALERGMHVLQREDSIQLAREIKSTGVLLEEQLCWTQQNCLGRHFQLQFQLTPSGKLQRLRWLNHKPGSGTIQRKVH